VHAEVAPEAFGRLEPALHPAQEGQLDGAADRLGPWQRLDRGGQAAFGEGLDLAQHGAG
jgi:hypothetical protein